MLTVFAENDTDFAICEIFILTNDILKSDVVLLRKYILGVDFMKKIVSLLLAFAVLLSVSVCSFSATSNEALYFEVTDELLEAVKVEFDDKEITKEDICITDLEVIDETKQLVRYTVADYGDTCEVVEQEIGDYLLYVPQRPLPQILVGSVLYDIKEAYENEILTDNDLATISTFQSDAYTFTKTGFTSPIEEPDIEANVFVDVSAVITGDEGFWAWIWDDNTEGHWVPMNTNENETGYFVVTMSVGQNVVFARIRSGEQPDWSLVWNQTEDTQYTGEYNCAVLSYSDTIGGKMPITWKNITAIDKNAMVKAMREAEKYIYEEADKYTADSISKLQGAYFNAQSCYESATTQVEVDEATEKLNTAISQLVLKDEFVTIDKTMLRVAIDTATSYYMSLDNFTNESWNTMEEKLANAYEVYENENATQAEVDLATQELLNAIDGLVIAEELIGDIDGDKYIGINDASLIQKHCVRMITLSVDQQKVADTDGDGYISIADASRVQKFLAKMIPEL